MSLFRRSRFEPVIVSFFQIAIGATGGLIFFVLGIPSAWMTGAMLATIAASAFGFRHPLSPRLRDLALLMSGASMGGGMTPDTLAAMGHYPLSLALLLCCVAVITTSSMVWLQRVSGWRKLDSFLASIPGALSVILVTASDRKAAVPDIAIVQSLRIFALVTFLPIFVTLIGGHANLGLPNAGMEILDGTDFAFVLLGGLFVGWIFERLRISAALLLGAAFASSIMHATSFTVGVIPPLMTAGGLVLIGIFVAERFKLLQWQHAIRVLPTALGSFGFSFAIAGLFAWPAAKIAGVDLSDALIAFAPGGQEAMMGLALSLGLNPIYVITHHLLRFIAITATLPILVARIDAAEPIKKD